MVAIPGAWGDCFVSNVSRKRRPVSSSFMIILVYHIKSFVFSKETLHSARKERFTAQSVVTEKLSARTGAGARSFRRATPRTRWQRRHSPLCVRDRSGEAVRRRWHRFGTFTGCCCRSWSPTAPSTKPFSRPSFRGPVRSLKKVGGLRVPCGWRHGWLDPGCCDTLVCGLTHNFPCDSSPSHRGARC